MATGQSSTPSFFNFLKEGLLLPTHKHNRTLFAAIFSILVASTYLLRLGNNLAVQPIAVKLSLDTKALNSTDPGSPDFLHLTQEVQDDTRVFWLASAAYFLFSTTINSAVRIVVLFAAVATYSGELHTLGSLLGKAKAQLKGPVLALAFVYALEIACVVLLIGIAMSALLLFLTVVEQYRGFYMYFVGPLLLLISFVFLAYFFFFCSLSVVVAVAEPGCSSAAALGRAWRLVKGKRGRATFFIAVTWVFAAGDWIVPILASRLLLGFPYGIFASAVELFSVSAMTAFYYECKGRPRSKLMLCY